MEIKAVASKRSVAGKHLGTECALINKNFITFDQAVREFAYLIDVEGIGWSVRVPYLLRSGRVLLYVERGAR